MPGSWNMNTDLWKVVSSIPTVYGEVVFYPLQPVPQVL